jgi:hypothetical protein
LIAMPRRLLEFLAGPELGLASTLLFAGLYTWPFFTFTKASATFEFIFVVWALHVALLAATSFASNKLAALDAPAELTPTGTPSK